MCLRFSRAMIIKNYMVKTDILYQCIRAIRTRARAQCVYAHTSLTRAQS